MSYTRKLNKILWIDRVRHNGHLIVWVLSPLGFRYHHTYIGYSEQKAKELARKHDFDSEAGIIHIGDGRGLL